MELTYSSYLQVPHLLTLQTVQSEPEEHDEMLFIIIHQTYELWFKLLLHELEKVCSDFTRADLYGVIDTMQRCRTIMKTLVNQLDILETMTPMSFTSFRDRLDTSSGFQSTQFRELEFILGYKRPDVVQYLRTVDPGYDRAVRRLAERSIVDHFYDFLEHIEIAIPHELREKPIEEATRENDDIQDAIFNLYKTRPDIGILFELMTDFDEGFMEWRYRHVVAVMRTIGEKTGTGGSPGIEFLKKSLFRPVFPDLWAVRHRL